MKESRGLQLITEGSLELDFFDDGEYVDVYGWLPEDDFIDYEDAPMKIVFEEDQFINWIDLNWTNVDYHEHRDNWLTVENIKAYLLDLYVGDKDESLGL